MRQNGCLFLFGIAVLALPLARTTRSVAAPDPRPAAHAVAAPAPAAPAAAHEEPTHTAAPSVQEHAAVSASSARQANSAQVNAPQASANTARSAAIDHRAGDGDHREDHHDRNRNLNNGNYGYAYYPFGPSYDYWNPDWNNYNNYTGPTYPGQFTQPDAAASERDQSDNQSLSAQTLPEVAPLPPAAPETTSAALNSALMASPQWRDADAQVRDAQSEYDAASAIVLAQLRAQPAYQQALAQKAADAQKLRSIKTKDPNAPVDRTESAATAKLSAAETVTQLQTAALAVDPRASSAKAKLDAAVTSRLEFRRQIEATHPTFPDDRK